MIQRAPHATIGGEPTPEPHGEAETPLTRLRTGRWARVRGVDLEADVAASLRAMGLRPGVGVRICRGGSPMIVEVRPAVGPGCRLGLSRRLACCVRVIHERAPGSAPDSGPR